MSRDGRRTGMERPRTARRAAGRRGQRLATALALALLANGCAAGREAPPRPAAPEPDLNFATAVDDVRQEALLDFRRGIDALADANPDAASERLLQVVDRCGSGPLGQQALLMLAIAELDPANRDPRLHLAVEASSQLALRTADTTWTHRVADALYLLARRLAPPPTHLDRMDVDAMRSRIESATTGRLTPWRDCAAVWAPGTAGEGELPRWKGTPYPVQMAVLRHQLRELREELERLRRLASQADAAP